MDNILGNIAKTIIGQVPIIGGLVNSPIGNAIMDKIGDALGLDDKSPENINEYLKNNPQAIVQLKQMEYDLKMAQIVADSALVKSDADDRANARARHIAMGDLFPQILSSIIVLGFLIILILLMFINLPDNARDILNIALGTLGSGFVGVINYWLGSSLSSKQKTALLAGQK